MTEATKVCEVTPQESEKSIAIENYIKDIASKYKQGEYDNVVSSLSNETEACRKFTDQYDIDITHPNIPIFLDETGNINNPHLLSTVISQILKNGSVLNNGNIKLPDRIQIVSGTGEPTNSKIPILWKKALALCCLEEWVHLLDNSKNQLGSQVADDQDSENRVMLYLHDNLGIKLPKYLFQAYSNRGRLKMPAEDHDFDSVDLFEK